MRPIAGNDILDFYTSGYDLLVLTAGGEYVHLDASDIKSSSYDDSRATAYDFVTTTDDTQVQVLLERATIADGDWFPDALDETGTLDPAAAGDMAAIITNDGILPGRVTKATGMSWAWLQAEQETNRLATARAAAVAEVVAYAGSQTRAAQALGLGQSTVNKLVKKHLATQASRR